MSDAFNLIVLAPILEELVFRLPLSNFFKNIFLSAALLVYAFLKTYLGIPIAIIVALAFAALPYIPRLINKHEKEVDTFIEKYYPYFFYSVALIFGFMHMGNLIDATLAHYLASPIIVLYQVLMGLLMGFIRVKYKWGILYAIFVHSFFNAIPILIKLL
jgi:membrane protease YdiL (CAAX protease family)